MNRRLFSTVLLALALGACASTPTISTDVAPGVDFSNFQTYQWGMSSVPANMDPVLGQRVMDAVDAQMSAKGYTKASPGDLTLLFNMGTQQKTDIESYGAWGMGLDVSQWTEGTLNIDAFNTANKQAVWHGSAKQDISDNPNPNQIATVVASTMKSFPPR